MKLRSLFLVLFFVSAFPLSLEAKIVVIDKTVADPYISNITDSINSYNRMIGTSSAKQSERIDLYKKYDKLVEDSNSAFALLDSTKKNNYAADDNAFGNALTKMNNSIERFTKACDQAKKLSKEEYRKFISSLSKVSNDILHLQELINPTPAVLPPSPNPNTVYVPVPTPGYYPQPAPTYPQPNNYIYPQMNNADFNALMASIKNESFDDSKLIIVNSAAQSNYFSVNQVIQILNSINFSDRKVKAAISLYPCVSDSQNWYQVYNAFKFENDKTTLRNAVSGIQNTAPATGYYTVMSTPDFEALMRALKKESFDDGKNIVLDSAAEAAYFRVDQVVSIVKSFTFGDQKTRAAIKLYPRVVDAKNWFKVYSAFTFENEKEEVRAGVASLTPAGY